MTTNNHPYATRPVFVSTDVNRAIQVFQGYMEIKQDQNLIKIPDGHIELSWLPNPRMRFFGETEGTMSLKEGELIVPSLQLSCRVFITNFKMGSREPMTCKGIITEKIIVGQQSNVEQIISHIPNFVSFIGDIIRKEGDGYSWRGRMELNTQDWYILIDENKNFGNIKTDLEGDGGYALTHTCLIKKHNSDKITINEAEDILSALGYFLSFVRGFWCWPVLPVGHESQNIIWQQWFNPKITNWKSVRSWFPHDELASFPIISLSLQEFFGKWQDPLWKESLQIAIHWYVEANMCAGGIEGSIVLTQNALELLGWVYFVEMPPTNAMSSAQFNKLEAAEKIRRLLVEFQIPVTIPGVLTDLIAAGTINNNVSDGPEIFVKLRNGVVHPKRIKRQFVLQVSQAARRQAWQLGLWYLELCLLKLLHYRGDYYQRFLTGYTRDLKVLTPWP